MESLYPEIIRQKYCDIFGSAPELIVRSPGRINLIGDHTDYNEGFVLPAAIDKAIYFAIGVRSDDTIRLFSQNLNDTHISSLTLPEKSITQTWANYILGVVNEILKADHPLKGFNLVFGGDLPTGGGLSSSAALENGIGFCLKELFRLSISRLELVQISKMAENEFVGMKCGIMDMFVSMMGRFNSVIRLDCRSLEANYFPFGSNEYVWVLCDTMVKHALVDSEYNTRRSECEQGVVLLKQFDPSIKSLRDVSLQMLEKHKDAFPGVVYQRCKFVLEENQRVEQACLALEKNDFLAFGELMYQSHQGLSELYEVSCEELNFLVDQAKGSSGVCGSRMMGGGFGGCTLNLIQKSKVAVFVDKMKKAYFDHYKKTIPCYVVQLDQGTSIVQQIR